MRLILEAKFVGDSLMSTLEIRTAFSTLFSVHLVLVSELQAAMLGWPFSCPIANYFF